MENKFALENKLKENQNFLDDVAKEVMKVYVGVRPPTSFEDSLSIARVSYKQALAMLEVRENALVGIAKDESKFFKKLKRDAKPKGGDRA